MPINVDEIYSGEYLNAALLAPLGKHWLTFIHQAEKRAIQSQSQNQSRERIVLILVSPNGNLWPRKLILGPTNAQILKAAWGPDAETWISRPLDIWTAMKTMAGKPVPGIVVAPGPQPAAAAVPPAPTPQPPETAAAVPSGALLMSNGQMPPAPPAAPPVQASPPADPDELDDEIPF
jgi:hypothetical protein